MKERNCVVFDRLSTKKLRSVEDIVACLCGLFYSPMKIPSSTQNEAYRSYLFRHSKYESTTTANFSYLLSKDKFKNRKKRIHYSP